MLALSPTAARAIEHLQNEARRKSPLTKVLIGDPGAGKTTFELAFFSRCHTNQDIVEVKLNLNVSQRFRPTDFMVSLMLAPALFRQAVQRLGELQASDSALYHDTAAWISTTRSAHLLRFFSAYAASGALPLADAALLQFHCAVRSWFVEPAGTKGQLSVCYEAIGGYGGRVPDAPKNFTEVFLMMQDFMALYKKIGLYPIWSIDEFESITMLSHGGKDMLLSTLRELIDAIHAPSGTGCLMVLTTHDGMRTIEHYPALSDRIYSSVRFTLPSICWNMDHFSTWDCAQAQSLLIGLYEQGAAQGDLICQAVVQALPEHLLQERFGAHLRKILQSQASARARLKHATVEVFDIMSEGSYESQARHFGTFVRPITLTPPTANLSLDSFLGLPPPALAAPDALPADARGQALDKDDLWLAPAPAQHASPEQVEQLDCFDILNLIDETQHKQDSPVQAEPFGQASLTNTEIDDLWRDPLQASSAKSSEPDAEPAEPAPLLAAAQAAEPAGLDPQAQMQTEGLIHYSFYDKSDKPASHVMEQALSAIERQVSLALIGRHLSLVRDIGGLESLPGNSIKALAKRAAEQAPMRLTFESAAAELKGIFQAASASALAGEPKRSYMALVYARRARGVTALGGHDKAEGAADAQAQEEDEAQERLAKDAPQALAGMAEAALEGQADKKAAPAKKKYRPALINPCHSLGAMRCFAYQFFLQRGVLPKDEAIDTLVLDAAQTCYGHKATPARGGIRFFQKKEGLSLSRLFSKNAVYVADSPLEHSLELLQAHLAAG